MGAFHLGDEVSHHTHLWNINFLSQNIETHKNLVKGLKLLIAELSLVELWFSDNFIEDIFLNILLYFFYVFLTITFFGDLLWWDFGFLQERSQQFSLRIIPQKLNMFKFDEGGKDVIIIFQKLV